MQNLQRVDIQVFTDEDCESLHAWTGPTSRLYHVCAGIVGGGKGQCNVSSFVELHNLLLSTLHLLG